MIDFEMSFLKFESEEEFKSLLKELNDVQENSSEIKAEGISFSVIGSIPSGNFTPVLDEQGNPVLADGTEIKPDGSTKYKKGEPLLTEEFVEGFHVNCMGKLPESFEKFKVKVNSPIRIFG